MWLRLIAAVATCWLAATARAEVFERDWKAPGDGLLTYDNVNRREWLDLSQTLLEQFAEPGAEFPEDHYANVVAELGPGGLFEGFTVAKEDDVIALAESAGIDPGTIDYGVNAVPMANLMDLIGVTHVTSIEVQLAHGLLDEPQIPPSPRLHRLTAVFQLRPPVPPFSLGQAQLTFVNAADLVDASTTGVMLFRVIPEPTSAHLALICIGATLYAAYRRHLTRASMHDHQWTLRLLLGHPR